MNIHSIISEVLTEVGVPFARLKYSGFEKTFVEYHEYLIQGETFDDNEESGTTYYLTFNVSSENDYTTLVDQIRNKMIEKNFYRISEFDSYDNDRELFVRTIRFAFFIFNK